MANRREVEQRVVVALAPQALNQYEQVHPS